MFKTGNDDRMVNLSVRDQKAFNQILADEMLYPTLNQDHLDRYIQSTKYFEVRDPNSKKYKYGGLDEDQIEELMILFPELANHWKYDGDWSHSFDRLGDFQERLKRPQPEKPNYFKQMTVKEGY